ncbi:MAG: NTP transferase domain-containing protein [Desulfobacteraceae bacterium]|nr:NTP transferase domain-containing protein [Desulfobacteraceae bacterium]
MNIAIITARKGSQIIKNKCLYPVGNKPLIFYPIQAALNAKGIEKVYITTDSKEIAEYGAKMGCVIINRPRNLSGPLVNHGNVIKHAVNNVDKIEKNLKNVVVLLGNTVMIDSNLIDESLKILEKDSKLDSVMSVWDAADDHPLRALEIHNNLIRTYENVNRDASTARQTYPKAYFYDQGVWAFRKYTVNQRSGPNPWWWMGKKCRPIIRTWVAGRDIHTLFDVEIAKWYLENKGKLKQIL